MGLNDVDVLLTREGFKETFEQLIKADGDEYPIFKTYYDQIEEYGWENWFNKKNNWFERAEFYDKLDVGGFFLWFDGCGVKDIVKCE